MSWSGSDTCLLQHLMCSYLHSVSTALRVVRVPPLLLERMGMEVANFVMGLLGPDSRELMDYKMDAAPIFEENEGHEELTLGMCQSSFLGSTFVACTTLGFGKAHRKMAIFTVMVTGKFKDAFKNSISDAYQLGCYEITANQCLQVLQQNGYNVVPGTVRNKPLSSPGNLYAIGCVVA